MGSADILSAAGTSTLRFSQEALRAEFGNQPLGHGLHQPHAAGAESVIAFFVLYQLNIDKFGDCIRVLRRRKNIIFLCRDEKKRSRRERAQSVRQRQQLLPLFEQILAGNAIQHARKFFSHILRKLKSSRLDQRANADNRANA